MSVIPKLFALYEDAGLAPIGGHNSHHMFDWRDAPFTRFLSKGALVGCAGLALTELQFVEGLKDLVAPRKILVIGNAHGWSTLFLALLFPEARVVAMDIDSQGVELTNQIARKAGIDALAVLSRSPDHVAAVHAERLGGPIDLALVDAVHTSDAIRADYAALAPLLAPDALVIFHDVINHNMVDGFQDIVRAGPRKGRLCTRTASGLGVLFDAANRDLAAYIECFSDNPDLYRSYRNWVLGSAGDPFAAFQRVYRRD